VRQGHVIGLHVAREIVYFQQQNFLLTFANPKNALQKFLELNVNVKMLHNVQSQTHYSCARRKQTHPVNVTQKLVHASAKHAVTNDKEVAEKTVMGECSDKFSQAGCDDLQVVHQDNVSLV
jgi:hypothetical protein